MGQTTPDLLPWPETGDPALVPQDIQELAQATQIALNARATNAGTWVALPASSGWTAGACSVMKVGALVVARGLFTRAANLNVTDNSEYQFATIPAGYRPSALARMAGTWRIFDGSNPQTSTTPMSVDTDGAMKFTAAFTGTVRAGGDYASAGGLVWWIG